MALIRVSGLWKHKDGQGMSGTQPTFNYVVLPNSKKVNDNEPDFYLYVGEKERKTPNEEQDGQ